MLEKKQLEFVVDLITAMINKMKKDKTFSLNKDSFFKYVDKISMSYFEAKKILIDLLNKDFFDNYYYKRVRVSKSIAKQVLIEHGADASQASSFLKIVFPPKSKAKEVSEVALIDDDIKTDNEMENSSDTKGENSSEKTDAKEEEIVSEVEPEVEEEVDSDNDESEEISEDEEVDSDDEDAEENDDETSDDFNSSSNTNVFKDLILEKLTFSLKLAIAIILLFFATKFIRPTGVDKFYSFYYITFLFFSIGVLICYVIAEVNIFTLKKFYKNFKKSRGRKEDLKSNSKRINRICNAYTESFLINETYSKTRSNADLYFGGEIYLQDMNRIPIQSFLKIIPGTFIGFGILGTFIGFAGGLSNINISDSQSLLNGVQNLLDGLKNAFNTSIVGVLASMFLNFVLIHPLFNKADRSAKELCDYLDTKFFVSEVDAMSVTDLNNKQIPFPQTMGIVLEKLEQVASNINQMGATVGDQVTQSVKATLDKTIGKIIKEEIIKLKEEMNASINLLHECQTNLQNAPTHLKSAAEKIQAAAFKNDELFKSQSQESIEHLIKAIEENLNAKFLEYAESIKETSLEMRNIKNAISTMPNDFSAIDKAILETTNKLADNQSTLAKALDDSSKAFEQTNKVTESLTESYDSQTEKIEKVLSKFTTVLSECKETSKESKELLSGFKGLDKEIAKAFESINKNTKDYSDIIGESLSQYLENFTLATKDVSKKFSDATLSLSEEVAKLNKVKISK